MSDIKSTTTEHPTPLQQILDSIDDVSTLPLEQRIVEVCSLVGAAEVARDLGVIPTFEYIVSLEKLKLCMEYTDEELLYNKEHTLQTFSKTWKPDLGVMCLVVDTENNIYFAWLYEYENNVFEWLTTDSIVRKIPTKGSKWCYLTNVLKVLKY